jgi:hypothetical protein
MAHFVRYNCALTCVALPLVAAVAGAGCTAVAHARRLPRTRRPAPRAAPQQPPRARQTCPPQRAAAAARRKDAGSQWQRLRA